VTATFASVQVLRMFDVAKARMFYVGYLGFHVDWEHRFEPGFPLYMQVSQNGLTLHLSEHHGDGSPGVVVVVRATGLEAYQREIAAKDYRFARPGLEVAPWNARVMEVIDPSGNRLRFNEPVAPTPR
jgi:catechol 2,3-dioxygenase-like lactoylglutathione lyase family enzyme